MDPEDRERILNEAIRIGDELVSIADHDLEGMSWSTMAIDDSKEVKWYKTETLYNGTSGIMLFLLQLYEQTKLERFLNAAAEASKWTDDYCKKNPNNNCAFYTGRMGASYAMLKMFETTRQMSYLDKSLEIAHSCRGFYNSFIPNDLLNGISGTILGLLHLYVSSSEEWILQEIHLGIKRLLDSAYHGPNGLYWDRSPDTVRGLCGFSHGAAGVGFVFLELGHYFCDSSFYWLAEQAFAYENTFFSESTVNWPDFRRGIYGEDDFKKHKDAYLQGDIDFFTSGYEMNAWCHGAVGIGLCRVRAFELLKDPIYKHDVDMAIAKTSMTNAELLDNHAWRTYTLCHGGGGNAELFLEAYRVLHDDKYLSLAEAIARQALESKIEGRVYSPGWVIDDNQEDRSLFMGNAGIGYFLLRLLQPLKTPSILAPKVKPTSKTVKANPSRQSSMISQSNIRRILAEKLFNRTLFLVQDLIPRATESYFAMRLPKIGERQSFIQFMENTIIPALQYSIQDRVVDVYMLELERLKIDESIPSNALLHIEEIIQAMYANNLLSDYEQIALMQFKLSSRIKILLCKWNWNLSSSNDWLKNLHLMCGKYPVLLRPSEKGVFEEYLSPFSYTVLSAFERVNTIENVVHAVLTSLEHTSSHQEKTVKDVIIQQIKQAINSGIIVPEESDNVFQIGVRNN